MDNQYNYYKPENDDNVSGTGNSYSYDNSYNSTYNSAYSGGGSYDYHHQQESPNPKRKFPKKLLKVVVTAIVFGVLAGTAFQGTSYLVGRLLPDKRIENIKSVASAQLTTMNTKVTSDVSEIVENTMPSIVSITNISVQQVMSWFGGISEIPSESAGSGIIISQNDTELLIVTNNHVIEGGDTLTVTFSDEASVEAFVKGKDSARDLAVIAVPLANIPEETLDVIKVAIVGDSDALKVGEAAIAIGNALGYGQSVTSGIVSAVQRSIEGYEGAYIQTDAAINPGNSGGALLNASGELIGINSAKISASSVEGMGFAIPISDVSEIIELLMNRETRSIVPEAERGYIGISGYDVTEEGVQKYGMPSGVYIAEVRAGGAAEKAGLTARSIISGFEGVSISGMEELQELLAYYRAGEEVTLTVNVPESNGNYVEREVNITLKK